VITAKDIEFHHAAGVNHEWAETNFFSFYVPEERLLGSIYTVARAGLGVCASEFIVYRGLSGDRLNVVHHDVQEHLPLPGSYSDYRLPNGMHVKAVNAPRDYRIDYVGRNGTELHIDYLGLMDPFDIHDASQNTRAHASEAAQVEGSGFGEGYKGHFDQTSHVKGELKLGRRTYAIDCVDTMDHSWGPRAEYGMRTLCWMHASFGKGLTVHLILHFRPFASRDQQYALAHGYVLREGKVTPIAKARIRADRSGMQGVAMEVEVTDAGGQSLTMRGGAIAGGAWPCYLCLHIQNTLHQWTTNDGRMGYGVVQDAWTMEGLAQRNLEAMEAAGR
jgi:hypothetical protein